MSVHKHRPQTQGQVLDQVRVTPDYTFPAIDAFLKISQFANSKPGILIPANEKISGRTLSRLRLISKGILELLVIILNFVRGKCMFVRNSYNPLIQFLTFQSSVRFSPTALVGNWAKLCSSRVP